MQTLAFQVDQSTDIELLMMLTNRIGIKKIDNPAIEILSFMNDNKIRLETAILMFESEKFSLGKASEFAGIHQFEFQKILAERKIPVHYDTQELEQDIDTLKSF